MFNFVCSILLPKQAPLIDAVIPTPSSAVIIWTYDDNIYVNGAFSIVKQCLPTNSHVENFRSQNCKSLIFKAVYVI